MAATGAPVWLAAQADAEAVAGLLVEFRDHMDRDWPSGNAFLAGVERLMGSSSAAYLLGAPDDDSPPSAVCQLRFRYGLWYAAEDCCLEDLYVRPEARGRGLGSRLVTEALRHAGERGARRIELDVNRANPGAVALYERFGFSARAAVTQERGTVHGENLLMRREL